MCSGGTLLVLLAHAFYTGRFRLGSIGDCIKIEYV